MKPVRKTLLAMVGAASDAKRQGWIDPVETTADASFEVRPIPVRHPRFPTGRAHLHVRGNGLGKLKMAAVLDFFHFQQIGWK